MTFLLWAALNLAFRSSTPPADAPGRIGTVAPAFELRDAAGKLHRLADMREAKLVVIAFLGVECPLAKLYAVRLNELAQEFGPRGVSIVGIAANTQDALPALEAFAREHSLTYPLLKDERNLVADQLGASRTPEVFLLDAKRVVRYQGRIDDQYSVGLKRNKPIRRDLADAMNELLDGKSVTQPFHPATGCLIGREKKASAVAAVTWSNQIARILQRRCVQCHREGEIGPFVLTEYRSAAGWGEMIREVVREQRMPPWFADPAHGEFSNDARLPQDERDLIVQWVDAGCPEGDPREAPAPLKFTKGWSIPKPDLILPMRATPYPVPATGTVSYKHFVVDPGFKEDKWVVASEVRPGNRAVVHHILVFLKKPGQSAASEIIKGSLLAAYAPGAPARQLPPGMALKIPAGSKIIFQLHYTPNGKETEDCSSLGLVFTEPAAVKQEIESGMAIAYHFLIPPGAKASRVTATHRFTEDRLLFNLTPHMHMRGKSFRYEARYPDGRREILLNVPRWDFNWQIEYELARPKFMPKGTVLHCTAIYDNSADNPANPDPTRWVHFGEQTWDEMMIGWFVTASVPKDRPAGP